MNKNQKKTELLNIEKSPIKQISFFFILLILEILILSTSLIFAFNININDAISQKNIPDIAKNIYVSVLYILVLANLYFLDKKNFIDVFKLKKQSAIYFFCGLSLGLIFLTVLYLIETIFNFIQIDQISINFLLIFKIFVLGFFVALLEELLFRNFIFRKLQENYKPITAFCVSSYIYSQLHFLRFDINFLEIILPLIGLFFTGIVFAYAFLKFNLWFSIGLHTAWIFLISFTTQISMFIIDKEYFIFTGGYYPVGGIFGILLILLMLFIIVKVKLNFVSR